MIIPKELQKVTDKIAQLQKELSTLKSLLQVVGQDMLTGINEKDIGSRVGNCMVEFKSSLEKE